MIVRGSFGFLDNTISPLLAASLGTAHVGMSRELIARRVSTDFVVRIESQQAEQLSQGGNRVVGPVAQRFAVGP